ncbi:tetratricopeptide repeat protein [Streptomyces sp. DSM 44917]|uniref:Tetratricopeptide repeat protein n=1 Tax=Streptomyces boetiae TaxID=3075541 RepID=A0ABU2L2J9_9ACTN|nr:tetratricopeptide repeat protein [Streptomyces sp. DSM 44917]MDT0305779.1 tetratricopeptide repeat protein [Streptomyces sp. DSM 44917]
MSRRERNTKLALLIEEGGWSLTQMAAAVNRVANEAGASSLRYDQTAVSHWISGTVPRPAARPFIREALSRRVRRPVTYAEIGIPAPADKPGTCAGTSTLEELMDLGRLDMDPSRRSVMRAGLYSVGLTIPAWPDVVGRMAAVQSGRAQRIGMADVDVVKEMTSRLADFDDDFGGRHARPLAASFLVNTLGPYLRADAPSDVRREMLSAAAFFCYITGWMAVDEALHGLAQQYYVKALELAGAAEDYMTYCHVLRGMSVQAADLGHGSSAVRLANAAADAAPSAAPRMRAFMVGQQAHAFALAGDRTAALGAIRETEVAIDKAESQAPRFGGFSPATLAYATAQVRYHLGDVRGSVEALQLHFRLRDPSDRRRTAVLFGTLLGQRQWELGHREAACATWTQVLDDYPHVSSGRADERVNAMRASLRPHLSNHAARAVFERARTIVAARSTAV